MDSKEVRWVAAVASDLKGLLARMNQGLQDLEQTCAGNESAQAALRVISADSERARQVVELMLATTEMAPEQVAALPIAAEPEVVRGRAGMEGYAGQIANPDGPNELILIVDDENFVTLLAERVLVEEGYRVLTAHDGFEAIKIFSELKDQIAMVVLDFTMPIMDGAEVFDELRALNPKVVVMVSSGFTEQERLKAMLAKGLKGFLPKPYTKQKLVSQIRSTLDALGG